MDSGNQGRKPVLFFCLCMLALLASCAPMPYLNVTYRLPVEGGDLRGRQVYLSVDDERRTGEILGEGARRDLKGFSGVLSLSVSEGTAKGTRAGIYELRPFLREVFRKRLENGGIEVLAAPREGCLELKIVLSDFLLDLVGRDWRFRMDYEAGIVRDGQVLSTQRISGDAERLKVIGRDQAEALLGEIITDMVNRLNTVRLFSQAGL